MNNVTPGDRIKNRRKELNLTQREVAKLAQVSHVSISKWESSDNEPRGQNLFQLSKALRCSPTWILFGDENHQPTIPESNEEALKLDDLESELITLFRSLPESEKERHIADLRGKVDDFNRLFYELLQARKSNKKK
ncbi:helix-turn-helix domain-containing protein [Klebsiella pneumoniae]|uniref:helix-turn-helix domain-containing protein n=1 Tax=Klebsiella pneumoniae TaxID=573 RepID=UPI000E2DD813|nr:helix-turn-helix domain-containing protein [Klebsiella pneumoniae]QMV58565.1 helix-turn-helix domain-containing protein [Klebsiella pneumoniae]SXH14532.1 transcriptional repressor DicA [Klebsiella pneumoniae]HBS1864235.1 helix-turn-helix domain-containing protein [Klebsiella pneumoniae]HBS1935673.1 helix-turn-helix domain-containing protein [Klebsiella pneumoniae]HBS2039116.1 helix-turn-helix domain-containing protein [Klebsiella pneumoniae]